MSPIIRTLTAPDADAFRDLRLRGLREDPTAFAASFDEEGAIPEGLFAERLAPSRDRLVLGAFEGDTLVGTLAVIRESKRKLAHKAFIVGVYVAPEARQRGAARAMMDEAMRHAFERMGVRQINLAVNAANPAAIALYTECGFEQFGLERVCMLVDGAPVDEIYMVCFRR